MSIKKTLFGCESVLPNFVSTYNKFIDNFIIDKVTGAIKCVMPEVQIDKNKLVRWVSMCVALDSIDESSAISLATQKKFNEKDYKIAVLEKALQLGCEIFYKDSGYEDCPMCEDASGFCDSYHKCKTCHSQTGYCPENKEGACWVDYFKYEAERLLNKNQK